MMKFELLMLTNWESIPLNPVVRGLQLLQFISEASGLCACEGQEVAPVKTHCVDDPSMEA